MQRVDQDDLPMLSTYITIMRFFDLSKSDQNATENAHKGTLGLLTCRMTAARSTHTQAAARMQGILV